MLLTSAMTTGSKECNVPIVEDILKLGSSALLTA